MIKITERPVAVRSIMKLAREKYGYIDVYHDRKNCAIYGRKSGKTELIADTDGQTNALPNTL